ncbi:MAG: hypothetical protein OCD01_03975 [Fibrobacterales bacterium]
MKTVHLKLLYTLFSVLIAFTFISCSLSEDVSGSGATEVGNPKLASVEGVLLNEDGTRAPFMPFILSQKDSVDVPLLLKQGAIELTSSDSGRSSVIDTTDSEGAYYVSHLIPGSYILTSSPDTSALPIRLEFSLTTQEHKTLAPALPQSPGSLSVTFTSQIHTVQLVTIRIYSPEQIYTHLYKEFDATFEKSIAPGTYFIRFIVPEKNGDNHLFINRTVTIVSGEENAFQVSIDAE